MKLSATILALAATALGTTGVRGLPLATEIPARTPETITRESSVVENADSFTLKAGGLGAFDVLENGLSTGDTLFFRYETLTGDFDKRVRLISLTTDPDMTEPYARAGLLLRESLDPAAPTLEIAAANPSGNNFVRVAGRGYPKQVYSQTLSRTYGGVLGNLPNQWLRMRRVGNAFAFYVSTNGTSWSMISEQYQIFPPAILFGTFARPDNASGTSLAVAEFADYGDVTLADTVAPRLLSVGTIDWKSIGVKFSEPMKSINATQSGNYTLSQGTVVGARVGIGGNTVYLDVAGLTSDTFSVTVNGLVDMAGNPLAAGSRADGQRSNWTSTDIGYIQNPANRPTPGDDPYLPGQAVAVSSDANPEVEIVGGGSNAWNSGDFMHYLYREYTGDFDVAVAVDRFDKRGIAGGYANAGFHIRASLYRDDNNAIAENTKVPNYVNLTYYEASAPNRSAIEINRANAGEGYGNSGPYTNDFQVGGIQGFFPALRAVDAAGSISPLSDPAQAKWLRVTRKGQNFTSFFSYDGMNWQEQSGSSRTMASLPATVLVGFGNQNDSGAGVPPNNTYPGNGTLDDAGFPRQNESNYGLLRIRALGDYSPPPTVPRLSVALNGAHVSISWPGVGYTLEQSANLMNWTDTTLPVDALGGINTVSVLPTTARQLFRLK